MSAVSEPTTNADTDMGKSDQAGESPGESSKMALDEFLWIRRYRRTVAAIGRVFILGVGLVGVLIVLWTALGLYIMGVQDSNFSALEYDEEGQAEMLTNVSVELTSCGVPGGYASLKVTNKSTDSYIVEVGVEFLGDSGGAGLLNTMADVTAHPGISTVRYPISPPPGTTDCAITYIQVLHSPS